MYALGLLSLALASSSLVSAAAVIPRVVQGDEVLAYGHGGRVEIVKLADWEAQVAKDNVLLGRPASPFDKPEDHPDLFNETLPIAGPIEKRCKNDKIITRYKDTDFYDWDIAMSLVVEATGSVTNIGSSVVVTVGNAVTTTKSWDLTVVKGYVATTISKSFEKNWSSASSVQYTLGMPPGKKYGIMVSNPRTYRRSGLVKTGCIGSQTSGYWQADEHFPQNFGELSWVQGLLRICTSNTLPIKYCIGDRSH